MIIEVGFRTCYIQHSRQHIYSLCDCTKQYLLKNTKLYVAFVDFKKALDSVNRNALLAELIIFAVVGKLYKAV